MSIRDWLQENFGALRSPHSPPFRESRFVVSPSFTSVHAEGNRVFVEPGRFSTFYVALHDLVDQWEANPSWSSDEFHTAVDLLCAEWY